MTYDYYNMVTGQKDIKGGKCKGAIFGVENVPYQVKIQSYLNVKAIMVSDYVIKDCSDFNWDQCSQDSKYCQRIEINEENNEDLIFNLEACSTHIVLYLIPREEFLTSFANVMISRIRKKISENIEFQVCRPNNERQCFTLSEDNCGDTEDQRVCSEVDCLVEKTKIIKKFCIESSDVQHEKLEKLCAESLSWSGSSSKTIRVETVDPTRLFTNFYFLTGVGLTLLFCCVCCSSIYYKFMMSRFGYAPCSCPDACPQFLFPRPDDDVSEDYSAISDTQIPLVILKDVY